MTTYNTVLEKVISNDDVESLKNEQAIQKGVYLLQQGEVVAFPTETVYGLGADATSTLAVKRIFEVKGRPQDNPLIIHIGFKEQLVDIVAGDLSREAHILIDAFWPGPLTLIFPKQDIIPSQTTAGLKTVAVRMPSHPVAKAILELSDLPVAAPSANSSGYPSPTLAQHVYHDLQGKIPLIIDGGPCQVGLESTVLDIMSKKPKILRPGGITARDLEQVLGYEVECNINSEKEKESSLLPLAPGMKYRHYSPATPLYLIKSEHINKNKDYLKKYRDRCLALVVTEETHSQIDKSIADKIIIMGSRNDLHEIAHNLFAILRNLDQGYYGLIIVETIPEKDLGRAIMNRLYKAAAKCL